MMAECKSLRYKKHGGAGMAAVGCVQAVAALGMALGLVAVLAPWPMSPADGGAVVLAVAELTRVVIRAAGLVSALLCAVLLAVCQVGRAVAGRRGGD
jgi:hypothetical protein